MLTKVDARNLHTVFKVTNRKGELICYRVFPDHLIGDAGCCREYPTLTEARNELGVIKHNNPVTAPKSSYVQNNAGYHASHSAKKEQQGGKRGRK
jgi:hypothetical protein